MKSGIGIYKIVNYISRKLSLIIFHQRLPLSYIIFNKLYKRFIVNNKIEDEDDIDLLTFIETSQENTEPSEKKHLVKLGDFSVFTNFLKKIIGPTSE